MAIRYSGDLEVRLTWNPRLREYAGSVRIPRLPNYHGNVGRQVRGDPVSPEAYDMAAREMIRDADAWARRAGVRQLPYDAHANGQVVIRRVFQAPCPVGRSADQPVGGSAGRPVGRSAREKSRRR